MTRHLVSAALVASAIFVDAAPHGPRGAIAPPQDPGYYGIGVTVLPGGITGLLASPLELIGALLGGGRPGPRRPRPNRPYRGDRDDDDDDDEEYRPRPNKPKGYPPVGLPVGFPPGYVPRFPPGAVIPIPGPANGGRPKGWPPVVPGSGIVAPLPGGAGSVGISIGGADFSVDGGVPTAPSAPSAPVPAPVPAGGAAPAPFPIPADGSSLPAGGISAPLPGGVGSQGLGIAGGDFSIDTGLPPSAPAVPAVPSPSPVTPPAAGITAALPGGAGEAGLSIGGASFSVDSGLPAPSAAAVAPVVAPVPDVVAPVAPVAPVPDVVAPAPVGITAPVAGDAGVAGLSIGGASFTTDSTVAPAPAAPAPVSASTGAATPSDAAGIAIGGAGFQVEDAAGMAGMPM